MIEKLKLFTEPVTAAIDACKPKRILIQIILTERNLWRSIFADSIFGRNLKNKRGTDIIFNQLNKSYKYCNCIPYIN